MGAHASRLPAYPAPSEQPGEWLRRYRMGHDNTATTNLSLLGQAEVPPVVSLGVLAGASVVAVAGVLALVARGYGLRS